MKKRHCVVITVYKDVNMRRCFLLNTLHDKMVVLIINEFGKMNLN